MTILYSKMVVLAIVVLAVAAVGDYDCDDDNRSLDSDDDGYSLYPILSKPAAAVAGDVDVDVGNKDVAHRGFAHDVAHHQQVL